MVVRDEEAIIEFDGDELLNLNKFGLESVRFKSNDGIENDPSCIDQLNDENRSKHNDSLNLSKLGKSKKLPDYREEYFLTNFGISMHDFMSQVKDCQENNQPI
jgi:hypothetical protein